MSRPMVVDSSNTLRFKANQVVCDLFEAARDGRQLDLNAIWNKHQGYNLDDLQEFYQMIGYSICGYEEIFLDKLGYRS